MMMRGFYETKEIKKESELEKLCKNLCKDITIRSIEDLDRSIVKDLAAMQEESSKANEV